MVKPSTLEGMPVELQIFILQQLPDLESVRCLITASPRYHRAYLAIRSEILFDHLHRQYGGQVDIAESLTAIRTKDLLAAEPTNTERIIANLDFRRRATREGVVKNYHHGSLSVEEIIELLDLHEAATFFLKDFSATLPRPSWWSDDGIKKWETTILPLCLSFNERTRFFRAFYRLQIWCNIFGQPEYYPSGPKHRNRLSGNDWASETFSDEESWRLLFGTIPPWEVEEVGCLWQYLLRKYTQIFEEITTVLIQRFKPKGPYHPPFAEDLLPRDTMIEEIYDLQTGSGTARNFGETIIEIGPRFLYKLLHSSYEDRQNAVALNVRVTFDKLWDLARRVDEEETSPFLYPAEEYERDDIATALLSFPVLKQPNLGWIRYWLGNDFVDPIMWEYINSPTGNKKDWSWGYVLWDTERLVRWKAPILEVENHEQ